MAILWGMLLTFNVAFTYQFGIGITLIIIFIVYIFVGVCDWYGHKWHVTPLTKFLFGASGIAAFLYCFVVIFLPSHFTYNGTTAIFLTFNYICASHLIYTKARNKNVKLSSFIKKLSLSIGDHYTLEEGIKLKKIIASAKASSSIKVRKSRYFAAILYLLSFAAYAFVIAIKKPAGNSLVGIVNVSLVIATDAMYVIPQICFSNKCFCKFLLLFANHHLTCRMYQMENRLQQNRLYIHSDGFKSMYMFFTRLMCCFLVSYWLSMQSFVQFVTMAIVAINLTHQIITRREKKRALRSEITYLYEICPPLKEYMQSYSSQLKCEFDISLFEEN